MNTIGAVTDGVYSLTALSAIMSVTGVRDSVITEMLKAVRLLLVLSVTTTNEFSNAICMYAYVVLMSCGEDDVHEALSVYNEIMFKEADEQTQIEDAKAVVSAAANYMKNYPMSYLDLYLLIQGNSDGSIAGGFDPAKNVFAPMTVIGAVQKLAWEIISLGRDRTDKAQVIDIVRYAMRAILTSKEMLDSMPVSADPTFTTSQVVTSIVSILDNLFSGDAEIDPAVADIVFSDDAYGKGHAEKVIDTWKKTVDCAKRGDSALPKEVEIEYMSSFPAFLLGDSNVGDAIAELIADAAKSGMSADEISDQVSLLLSSDDDDEIWEID